MLPCGRTDEQTNKQTSENRATQSLDSVRLSFAKKIFLQKLNLQKQKRNTFSSLRNRPVRCRRDQTVGRQSPKNLSLIFYLNVVFLREIWDQFIFWGPPGYHRQCKHKLPEDKDQNLGIKLSLRDLVLTY